MRGTADGRVLRGRRNREAVVEAFLSLIEEGDQRPTARAIAARAGLSTRSVFQHFADLEQIYEVAGRRQVRALRPLLEAVDPTLPLPERVERFVTHRSRLLERLDPVARAARLREPFSDQLQANRDTVVRLMRAQVCDSFAPELRSLDPAAGDRSATALASASSWAAWYHLRNDQGLDVAAAAEVLRLLIWGVLTAALVGVDAGGGNLVEEANTCH
jgi:TetR/AcrR family transcriptional regulator of autoinduction and epiphytic fitness